MFNAADMCDLKKLFNTVKQDGLLVANGKLSV